MKKFKQWLSDRRKEPTSIIGLALIVQGIGALTKMNEAPYIADSLTAAADPLARGDYATAGTMVLGGIMAILMREKGSR